MDSVLKTIELAMKEINGEIVDEEIPQLMTREETIRLQLAVIKTSLLLM